VTRIATEEPPNSSRKLGNFWNNIHRAAGNYVWTTNADDDKQYCNWATPKIHEQRLELLGCSFDDFPFLASTKPLTDP